MSVASTYRGSLTTAKLVRDEIRARWGDEAAEAYDPYTNCLTFRQWEARQYRVKKGEKSIRSFSIIYSEDRNSLTTHSYRKTVHLFYHTQVEPIL